jgi:hypothetical protein
LKDLIEYKHSHYSQNGEDGIFQAIFGNIGLKNKWCVEVGAHDGVEYSNTFHLVKQGWDAVEIECSVQFEAMERSYKDYPKARLVRQAVSPYEPDNLDVILSKFSTPKDIQLMVIDVDGDDYYIWKTLKYYDPIVIMVEFNPSFPLNVEFIPKEGTYIGSSLLSLYLLGLKRGYSLVCCVANNAIFLRNDYHLDIPNDDFRYLYYVGLTDLWAVAQSFDGTAYVIDPTDHMKNKTIKGYQELYDLAEHMTIHKGRSPWQS